METDAGEQLAKSKKKKSRKKKKGSGGAGQGAEAPGRSNPEEGKEQQALAPPALQTPGPAVPAVSADNAGGDGGSGVGSGVGSGGALGVSGGAGGGAGSNGSSAGAVSGVACGGGGAGSGGGSGNTGGSGSGSRGGGGGSGNTGGSGNGGGGGGSGNSGGSGSGGGSGGIGKPTPAKLALSNPSKGQEALLPIPDQKQGAPQQPVMLRPGQGARNARGAGASPAMAAAQRNARNSPLISDQMQVSEAFLKEMAEENIHQLKKKSIKFPKAQFFCRTCEYHLDRPEDCRNHLKDNRHKRATEVIASANILKVIPPPLPGQIEKLTEMVCRVCAEHGLSSEDMQKRQRFVEKLQEFIELKMQGTNAKLRMYGSSLTGLGLKDCDINVDLYTPNTPIKPKMLLDLHEVAKAEGGELFSNITCNFSSLVPTLLLTEAETGLVCQVAVACYTSYLTSHLLKAYSCLDPRVTPLCVTFRHWAKLCKLDKHDYGTLPPYAYDLMTLHYLQRTQPPVLPFLSKNLPQYDVKNPKEEECAWFVEMKMEAEDWKSSNTESLGELWLGMLRYYCITFDMASKVVTLSNNSGLKELKCFHRKKLGIDDPYLARRNVARTLSSNRIHDYLQDCLRQSFLYFALPRDQQGESYIPREQLQAWVAQCQAASGNTALSCKDAARASPKPQQQQQQPSDTAATNKGSAQQGRAGVGGREGKAGVDCRLLNDSNNACLPDRDHEGDSLEEDSASDSVRSYTFTNTSHQQPEPEPGSEGKKTSDDADAECPEEQAVPSPGASRDEFADSMASTIIDSALHGSSAASTTAAGGDSHEGEDAGTAEAEQECHYEFTASHLAAGDGPVVICGYCEKEGHLKANCPEDTIPPPVPLPPLTKEYVDHLNEVLEPVPGDFMPTDEELKTRQQVVDGLQEYIRQIYPDASLRLFGSSRNGFVFNQSDLDICITFANKSPESVDPVKVIEKLAKHLRYCKYVDNITPITTAKVPIVKFFVKGHKLDGDISVYNILAQHNTSLLECYSRIDKRVQTLGYLIKVFVKICEIGDASKGSLSSYAYILMVLHYLQQRRPPVIPVLQELHSGEKPVRMVEGWNAWFYDDIPSLPKVWEDYGKNKESVAELWIGMFRYYTEEFNCKQQVVCVRQHAPLTRFEKLWNGSCLAIEDPFELTHNLGTGLNKKMNNFIFTVLQRGRMLYGTPVASDAWKRKFKMPQDYFFDARVLRASSPPNDRGCRICGRIGHIAKQCTERRDKQGKLGSNNNSSNDRKKTNCFKCGDNGHIARDCPRNNADWSRNNSGAGAVSSPLTQQQQQQQSLPPQNLGFGPVPPRQQWPPGRPLLPQEAMRGARQGGCPPGPQACAPYRGGPDTPLGGGSGGGPGSKPGGLGGREGGAGGRKGEALPGGYDGGGGGGRKDGRQDLAPPRSGSSMPPTHHLVRAAPHPSQRGGPPRQGNYNSPFLMYPDQQRLHQQHQHRQQHQQQQEHRQQQPQQQQLHQHQPLLPVAMTPQQMMQLQQQHGVGMSPEQQVAFQRQWMEALKQQQQQQQESLGKAGGLMGPAPPGLPNPWMQYEYAGEGQGRDHPAQKSPHS